MTPDDLRAEAQRRLRAHAETVDIPEVADELREMATDLDDEDPGDNAATFAVLAALMGVESHREWAVIWPPDEAVEPCAGEIHARRVARQYRGERVRLVSRTVTTGLWADAPVTS